MKFVSWNVNGLRACLEKGFLDVLNTQDADFFCIQETKMQEGQASFDSQGYDVYYNSAQRKGYSGTAIFTRHKPLSVTRGIGKEEHDTEGRVITLEFPTFFLVNVYTPEFASRTCTAVLPHGVGRCVLCISLFTRCTKARHCLRRFQCCTQGNRLKKSAGKP